MRYQQNGLGSSALENSAISDWLNDNKLVLDEKDSFTKAVSQTMMHSDSKCYEPFVVLKDGRYYGTVTIRDLVLAISKENSKATK